MTRYLSSSSGWGLALLWVLSTACAEKVTTLPVTDTTDRATISASPPPGYELVWSDEFDQNGLPAADKWNYDLGGHGWGNAEQQHYTQRAENARVEDGHLIIEAHREPHENSQYTSARLVTRDRQTWTYGYLAVRAKLPSGRGTWPAIWMLGENIESVGWPDCGEIDIMEHVGYNPDSVYATIHCKTYNHLQGTQHSERYHVPAAESAFHTYALHWTPQQIEMSIDGDVYFTFVKDAKATTAEWPFDAPHYLLLNLAVGGHWGASQGVDETIWPQRMEIDWVRIWQRE